MSGLGIVVIGRNEGERLIRCLESIPDIAELVYVDSGSTDGSVAAAKRLGATVVELNMSFPFTAARARNAGRGALPAGTRFAQFVDGDCVLQPGWLAAGQDALERNDTLAAVFGSCREIAPEASRYNWLCDVEWAVAPGLAQYFGGIVMLRLSALDAAGGYPSDMIAGEEPDLAIRLRAQGWTLACLAREMTLHDAAITRFGQWWGRAGRSGHAFAELAARHRGSPLQNYSRRMLGALTWGALLPLTGLALLAIALVPGLGWFASAGGLIMSLPLAQFVRLTLREVRHRPLRDALTLAAFLMLAKPAQSLGIARYWRGRFSGTRSRIIEYKQNAA